MSQILDRTSDQHILDILSREDNNSTSVGKRGIGMAASAMPYLSAIITALGAMGPRGSGPRPNVSNVTDWLSRVGIQPRDIHTARTGTQYIRSNDPQPRILDTARGITPTVSVRIPNDGHQGNRVSPYQIGNLFDTGTRPGRSNEPNPTTHNISGGSYSDINNLIDALRWRFSRDPDGQWLIPPDQAPIGIFRSEPPVIPRNTPDPNQLNFNSMLGINYGAP